MLLLLNIGNTHTRIAESDGETLRNIRSVPTAELNCTHCSGYDAVLAATVVPEVKERLKPLNCFWLSNDHAPAVGLDLSQVDASTLGADRLANAIELVGNGTLLPALVFDFGTAINCEVVDRGGVFRGGAILPGRLLMRRALFAGTAQLPELPLTGEAPLCAGTDTPSTILLGVDRGVVGAVRELVAVLRAQFGANLSLVATGGDAAFFRSALPEFENEDDLLTLRGLLRAWRAVGK